MKLIKREKYLNELIGVIGTPDIKVITGIRRSGKSKLLEAFKKYIEENIKDYNIIHINYSLSKFDKLKECHKLYEYIESNYRENMNNFVLIDEVQMCDGFETAINWIHAEEKYDIYITGSNAFLLSSDLATLFTGRTFPIEVYPFSFSEFMKYYGYDDADKVFDEYVIQGGMAGSYVYTEQADKYKYIEDVYNTLIVRDIKKKYNIRNEKVLNNLSNFLMDNVSNITSTLNITKELNNKEDNITDKTINKYIGYLCNAFAFYKIGRYDIKGKKYLTSLDKYYMADHSFRYAMLGITNMNYGRTYENIVAIELMRRGYDVYVGTLYNKEIDFVAQKHNEKIYIQVSDNISEEKTFKREIDSLLKIKDAYPKMLIARTRHDDYTYEGILVKDIANWLADK
ncbi:MAG: ATP-binding protein [Clostridium sp.]|nr:ATP-binding protein [Clostridium sp.]